VRSVCLLQDDDDMSTYISLMRQQLVNQESEQVDEARKNVSMNDNKVSFLYLHWGKFKLEREC
jgi:hypothetical protein